MTMHQEYYVIHECLLNLKKILKDVYKTCIHTLRVWVAVKKHIQNVSVAEIRMYDGWAVIHFRIEKMWTHMG